ncbi:hypothetical protein ANO11243_085970 [Dothideomycetidae sp. 11243]|nr:hypothetical protein ANO11243_085970 [fungal sp. No.11243]
MAFLARRGPALHPTHINLSLCPAHHALLHLLEEDWTLYCALAQAGSGDPVTALQYSCRKPGQEYRPKVTGDIKSRSLTAAGAKTETRYSSQEKGNHFPIRYALQVNGGWALLPPQDGPFDRSQSRMRDTETRCAPFVHLLTGRGGISSSKSQEGSTSIDLDGAGCLPVEVPSRSVEPPPIRTLQVGFHSSICGPFSTSQKIYFSALA